LRAPGQSPVWRCDEGQTIFLIDKNLKEMHHLVDRHYIIEKGRIVWGGNSQALQEQPDLVTQYLGI